MGQSTNAVMFYGYCWLDELRWPWDHGVEDNDEDDDDWQKRYARLGHAIVPPAEPFPSRQWSWSVPQEKRIYPADEQAIVDKYTSYWARCREISNSLDISVDTHCSSDCPMPYVCIASTELTCYRGDRQPITEELGQQISRPNPEWKLRLDAFCNVMKISIPDEGPKWWLVSYWG